MQKVAPILKSLGLLDSEISTYLAALVKGPSTVIDLSKKSKLSRQATYTAIEMLTERGLMSSVQQGKKRLYAAEPATKLLAYAKRKDAELHDRVSDLERLLPDIELQTGGEKPVVKVFEGKEGIKAIIQDMLQSPAKESFELTDLDAMHAVISSEELKESRSVVKRTRRKVRGIYSGEPKEGDQVDPESHVFLPSDESGFEANIGIYGNRLACMTFKGKMYSVLIDSEPLVKAMRILFKHAMKGLKK